MKTIKKFLTYICVLAIILTVILFATPSNNYAYQDSNENKISSINTKKIINKNEECNIGEKVQQEQEKDNNISTAVAQARVINNDSSNIWWLACTIYHEGRDLSDEAQIAIASIVLNRVNSPNFPNNLFEVLVQPGQYSFVNDEIIDGSPDDRALANAIFVYRNGSQVPNNVVYQSMFEQGSEVWKVIEGEYFCYE